MQQHGFARNLEWEIGSTSADLQPDERDPEVELVLTDNDYTRAMWYVLQLIWTLTRTHAATSLTSFVVAWNLILPQRRIAYH